MSKFNPNIIRSSGRKEVTPRFQPNSYLDAREIRNYYREIFKDKVLGEDQELMEIVINNVEELRPRFSATINLYSQGKEVAVIGVYSCLIENGQKMVNYWYGIDLDPSNFESQKNDFFASISQDKITQVNVISKPTKQSKVDGISVTFAFA